MRHSVLLFWVAVLSPAAFAAESSFDATSNTWSLTNGWVRAAFQLTPQGHFLTQSMSDLQTGDQWVASPGRPSSLVNFQVNGEVFDAARRYVLLNQFQQAVDPAGLRQSIQLEDVKTAAEITVTIEVYDRQPVVRYSLVYRNPTGSTVHVKAMDLVPWAFADAGQRYTAFRASQWSVAPVENFGTTETLLDPAGTAFQVYSGARAQHCGWLALRDSGQRGLFAGWEFDGRMRINVSHQGSGGYVLLSSTTAELNHPVGPAALFQTPYAFLGLFHGDFDEAAYRTQRFMEAVLARPAPVNFPYVAWDSWAYGQQIDEQTLLRNADIAASLGVELFLVDLGWARSIGDWYADPAKFPHGLGSVADYVHSLGMKFGLHFPLAEAAASSPVLEANPDWTSTESDNYFGALSLCLSHQPARDWLIQQATRMIDDYHVDWILQDGDNMVKQCTKTTHTHDPGDSNYANSVDGLNYVVSAIQRARPAVYWENCEGGGKMMTFNMVKSYVTSITNDASGALESRQAAYGATFPFSPRFAERYMPPDDGFTSYATASYRFGGNWAVMVQLLSLVPDQLSFLAKEIQSYKDQRALIAGGMVHHLAVPGANAIDAIESYNAESDSAIAVITREQSPAPDYLFKPRGLNPSQRYSVWFEVSPQFSSQTGEQLMTDGVEVPLPSPKSSEIVHIERP